MARMLAAVITAILISGCTASGPEGYSPPEDALRPLTVRVENRQWFEMRIFFDPGVGPATPLGIVRPRSSAIFRLPAGVIRSGAELRLMADPVGSTQRMTSEPLELSTGHTVHWQLRKSGRTRLTIR